MTKIKNLKEQKPLKTKNVKKAETVDVKTEILKHIKEEDTFRVKTINDNRELFDKWEKTFQSGVVKSDDVVKLSVSSLALIEDATMVFKSNIELLQEMVGVMGVMERRLQRALVDVVLSSNGEVEKPNKLKAKK